MYRGSSFILDTSVKHYEALIKAMAEPERRIYWEIDVDSYTPENIERLLDCKKLIVDSLERENNPSDTLVTKIMLGMFGNTPALDINFINGMKKEGLTVRTFNKKSLENVHEFYRAHKSDFDCFEIPTIDFMTGNDSKFVYTKAKLIDMAAFQEGLPKK